VIASHDGLPAPFFWVVVEMKTASADDGDLRDQITAANEIINAIESPMPAKTRSVVAVLHKRRDRTVGSIVARMAPIEIRGQRAKAVPWPCGTCLSEILSI
jgi:hypothetical protein